MKKYDSLRKFIYEKAGGDGSFLNTEVTPKGLLKTIGAVAIATTFVLTSGCTGMKNYGSVIPMSVETSSSQYHEEENLEYYLTGDKDSPKAIIGIDKSCKLEEGTSWKSLKSQGKTFQEVMKYMRDNVSEGNDSLRRYDLVGPEGRDVGNLYFKGLESGVTIKKKEDGSFYISTPDSQSSTGGGGGSGGSGGGGAGSGQ